MVSSPDAARLDALLELAILDSDPEQVYDDVAAIAAAVCQTPMAAITLLDSNRQWFKAQVGLGISETPRTWSFCEHAMAGSQPVFEVPDALADDRFSDNPLVVGTPDVRFYAGAPLVLADGQPVGALCVLDTAAKRLTLQQRDALAALGRQVEALLEARRAAAELARTVKQRDAATGQARLATEQTRAVFDGISAGLTLLQLDGTVIVANPAMAVILKLSPEEMTGRSLLEFVAQRDRRTQTEILGRLRDGNTDSLVHEVALVDASGAEQVMIATASLIRDEVEAVRSVLIRFDNIDDRRRAEVELREAQSARDGIVTVDAHERIVSWNEGAVRLFGHSRLSAIGRDLSLIVPPGSHAAHARGFARLSAGGPPVLLGTTVELEALREDGTLFPIELSLSRWYRGEDPYYTAVIRDITERRRNRDKQLWTSTHDLTTSLGNLAGLRLWCEQNLAVAAAAERSVAMVSLHLTGLGAVSAAMGPQATELLLVDMGAALREASNVEIEFFHLGESHFAGMAILDAVAPDKPGTAGERLTMDERLNRIAAFVLDVAAGPFMVDEVTVELDARVGVVASAAADTNAEELLRRAEAVQTTSPHRVNVSSSYRTDRFTVSREDVHLMSDLRRGVSAGELELFYQPVVATNAASSPAARAPVSGAQPDRRVGPALAVEALVRWNHPIHGLLQPGQFIELAENSTLISPLTRWVLHEALRQNRSWSAAGLDVKVAVNVSPRVLLDDDVALMVRAALDESGCPAAHLKIEVTESAIVADPGQARETVAALRRLGVGVSIDDFGTGFTSLDLLRAMEISEVKLDRTFVSTATTTKADRAIVTTVVDLAHRLGLDVVAEGVEDEATAQLLRDLRYDFLQGYLFSRPVPAAQAAAWLSAPAPMSAAPVS